jgi:7-cyano-7-deazaguanine synthase
MAWEGVERRWLARFVDALGSPQVLPIHEIQLSATDIYGGHWSVAGSPAPDYEAPDETMYLPGRNLLLTTKAAVYCSLNDIHRIAMGVLAGNPFPDATDAFFDAQARALSLGLDFEIQIERPLAKLHKAEVVQQGDGVPLELTFSCVQPVGEVHCGSCNKCAERQHGFEEAGVPDPTAYARVWVKR